MPLIFRWEKEFKKGEALEIPIDWNIHTIRSSCKHIQKGKVPKKSGQNNIYPYLSTEYLRETIEAEKYFSKDAGVFVNEGDLIIILDGSNSGEIFEGKTGILSSTMAKVELKGAILKKFFFYYLKDNEDDIKSLKFGSDDRHLDKEGFLNTVVRRQAVSDSRADFLSYGFRLS
jgi:type I restriction enzyme, S subunit